jgi:hypothetical protein
MDFFIIQNRFLDSKCTLKLVKIDFWIVFGLKKYEIKNPFLINENFHLYWKPMEDSHSEHRNFVSFDVTKTSHRRAFTSKNVLSDQNPSKTYVGK